MRTARRERIGKQAMNDKLDMNKAAVELVFTYSDWTSEHVHEYYICAMEPPKYSEDDFYTACQIAENIKQNIDNPNYDSVLAEIQQS